MTQRGYWTFAIVAVAVAALITLAEYVGVRQRHGRVHSRKLVFTEMWVVGIVWDLIARIRGRPTRDEIDEDNEDLQRISEIIKEYSSDQWWQLQKHFPEPRLRFERLTMKHTGHRQSRSAYRSFLDWIDLHKKELQKYLSKKPRI